MATFNTPIMAVGLASGLTGTLGYTIKSVDGVTTLAARSTAGVREIGSTGTYVAEATIDTDWTGVIEWDAGAGVLASSTLVGEQCATQAELNTVLSEVQAIAAGETDDNIPAELDRFVYPPPSDPRNTVLNRLLYAAWTRPVYAVCFGDSQEAGSVWQAAVNAEFRRIYGDSPGSTFMPLNESGWESGRLWCQGVAANYGNGAQIGGPVSTSSATTSSFNASTSNVWSTTDDALIGWWVRASIGGVFEYRQVSDYVGSTRTVTVSPAFSSTIPASVVLSPVDPRRAPPNLYGRAANDATAARFVCRPDNAFGLDKFGVGRLDTTRTQQVLKLPDLPANLNTGDTINLRVVYLQTATAPDATVLAKPHNSPIYSPFSSTSATLTTVAAELQGSDFVGKVYALPYEAHEPYMQAHIGSTANAVTNPLIVVGARYEVPGSHGILLDSFSAGGYSVANLLANHANMADFFAAMPTYEIAMIHLGINDAYSQGKTAATFKTELQQLIDRVKDATGCTVVLLINDVMNIDGTSGQDAEFAQYGEKMRELCDENANVLMRDMRAAFAESSFNQAAEDELVIRGRWFSFVSYNVGDVVINGHTSNTDGVGDYQFYQCISAHSNQRPPNATYWRAMLWKPGISYTAGDICYLQFPTDGWSGFFKASTSHSANAASNSPFSQYPEWIPVRQWLNDQVHLTPDGQSREAAVEVKLIMATALRPINPTGELVEDIATGAVVVRADDRSGNALATSSALAAVQTTASNAEGSASTAASAATSAAASAGTAAVESAAANTRVQTALPNAAPGATGGLARTEDLNVSVNVPAPQVSPVLVASPVVSQLESAGRAVRVGPVRPVDYQFFQHTAAALPINPVDAAGEPIDLTGRELRFLVHDSNGVVKFQLGADDGVVFTEGTVTVPIAAANLATKADWQWKLRDLTGEIVLGYGRFEILLAPLSSPTP